MIIIWTNRFGDDYAQNLGWLEEEFGQQQVISFIDEVEEYLRVILHDPFAFPVIKNEEYLISVRRCVVHPRIAMYYHVDTSADHIILLRFWNTSQDPSRLRL